MKISAELLSHFFRALRLKLTGLSSEVGNEEPIARLIHDKSYFRAEDGYVSTAVFHPRKVSVDLSALRLLRCSLRDVWGIADRLDSRRSDGRRAVARADLEAKRYRDMELRLNALAPGHVRHVNIEGWPEKGKLEMVKSHLAHSATLQVRPRVS